MGRSSTINGSGVRNIGRRMINVVIYHTIRTTRGLRYGAYTVKMVKSYLIKILVAFGIIMSMMMRVK
jgi:hypothetical protein